MTKRVGIIGTTETVSTNRPKWRDDELQAFEKYNLNEGVLDREGGMLAVTQKASGANMSVDLAPGAALVQITNTNLVPSLTYLVYIYTDTLINLPVSTADATHPRIDRIVARVGVGDGTVGSGNPDPSASNIAHFEIVIGTPGAVPVAPAEPANSITLATYQIPAGSLSVTNAMITDTRPRSRYKTTVMPDLMRQGFTNSVATDVAGTNALTMKLTPALEAYTDQFTFLFKPVAANTGAVTISINGLPAKSLKKYRTLNLIAGDLDAGLACLVMYDLASDSFKLISQLANPFPTPYDSRFGDGSDGALNVLTGTTQIDCNNQSLVVKNYTSVNIASGAILEFINVPDAGVVFVPKVQGNWVVPGNIDGRGDGSKGGNALVGNSMSEALTGNAPTAPFGTFGESHAGGGGNATQRGSSAGSENGSQAGATGGAGSGNLMNDGLADSDQIPSTSLNYPGGALGGAAKGVKRTQSLSNLIASMQEVIAIAPGTGGPTGGVAIKTRNASGTAPVVTAGKGGRGGITIMPIVGGDYDFTGQVDVRGMDADAGSIVTTGLVISGSASYALAYGGSVGGAGGIFAPHVKGNIIADSGTVLTAAGASTNGAGTQSAVGSNTSGTQAFFTNGTTSAAGRYILSKIA